MKKILIFIVLTMIASSMMALNYSVTVPIGTKACYIAGEMNNWSQQAMTKVDETHYTIAIASATIGHKYKYCSGPNWSYVENIADNRSYTVNDIVTSWSSVYDPSAIPQNVVYTVTVPAGTNVCYFVGKATGWAHKQMSRLDNTHFTITVNTTKPDIYKYCSGPDWAYEELDADGETISERSYKTSDVVAKWKLTYYSSPIGVAYNVTVPSGTKSCFLSGDFNSWGFTAMTKTDDTHFALNIPNANTGQKYVYCSGPDISFKETNANGTTIAIRAYKPSDVVVKWPSVYTPTTSLELSSDFAQKSYECGTILPITWSSVNVQNVRILFSGDYGLTWTEVASSIPATNGKYDWTLPTQALYQCRIMICDVANSQVNSISNGMFVIYNHLPEKVEPLLKTNYQVFLYPYNSKYPTTDDADSENINGKVGNACGPTAVSNILTFWEFPRKGFGSRTFTDVRNCVWSANFSAADYNYDLSSDQLTTNSPQTIIDANATLMYHAGVAMHNPYRSGNSIGVLNAFKQYFGYNAKATELNRDDYSPEQWEKIMKSELSLGRPQIVQGWGNIFEDGGYGGHWFMCDGYSADNLFHISLDYGADGKKYCPLYAFDVYKMKNWIFAYLEPEKNGKTIQLNLPAGGENWQQGTERDIRWSSTGISNVKIEFSENNGESWSTLANNIPAGTGSYKITLPVTISGKCKIRLSDVSDMNIYSRNKTAFSIYDSKRLQLKSTLASKIQTGVSLPIRWTSKGVGIITIEYSTDNGQNWNFISENSAQDSVYKWIVPNITSSNYKIRISDKSDNSLFAESTIFSVVSNSIIGGPYAVDENTLALYHFDTDYVNSANVQVYSNPFNSTSFISNDENKTDYALRIDNTNSSVSSCVVLPHDNPLSLTGDWTIEFWFKINSWGGKSTAYPFLFIKSGANYFVFLDVSSKSLQVGYDYNGGAETLNLPANTLELNKWYHIIYIRNTSNSTLNCQLRDINRKQLISKSTSFNPLHIPKTNTDPINIGGYSGGSNVQFDGFIDEVRVSNIVRSFVDTGTDEIKKNPIFSIYPNPTNSFVKIHLEPYAFNSELYISNTAGQIVFRKKITNIPDLTVDLTSLRSGIYLIHISGKGIQTQLEKLIIK